MLQLRAPREEVTGLKKQVGYLAVRVAYKDAENLHLRYMLSCEAQGNKRSSTDRQLGERLGSEAPTEAQSLVRPPALILCASYHFHLLCAKVCAIKHFRIGTVMPTNECF